MTKSPDHLDSTPKIEGEEAEEKNLAEDAETPDKERFVEVIAASKTLPITPKGLSPAMKPIEPSYPETYTGNLHLNQLKVNPVVDGKARALPDNGEPLQPAHIHGLDELYCKGCKIEDAAEEALPSAEEVSADRFAQLYKDKSTTGNQVSVAISNENHIQVAHKTHKSNIQHSASAPKSTATQAKFQEMFTEPAPAAPAAAVGQAMGKTSHGKSLYLAKVVKPAGCACLGEKQCPCQVKPQADFPTVNAAAMTKSPDHLDSTPKIEGEEAEEKNLAEDAETADKERFMEVAQRGVGHEVKVHIKNHNYIKVDHQHKEEHNSTAASARAPAASKPTTKPKSTGSQKPTQTGKPTTPVVTTVKTSDIEAKITAAESKIKKAQAAALNDGDKRAKKKAGPLLDAAAVALQSALSLLEKAPKTPSTKSALKKFAKEVVMYSGEIKEIRKLIQAL